MFSRLRYSTYIELAHLKVSKYHYWLETLLIGDPNIVEHLNVLQYSCSCLRYLYISCDGVLPTNIQDGIPQV